MELLDLPSRLAAVTVFSRGALCTRTARLEPAEGVLPRRVRVTGLPLSLTSGSLRARIVSGPAGLRLSELRQSFDVALREEVNLAAEEKAVRVAEDEVRRLEREHGQLGRELSLVAALRPTPPPRKEGDPPRPAPVDAMLVLARFVGESIELLQKRRRELEERLVDARNELELRRQRLQESSTARRTSAARVQRAAVLSLDGGLDGGPRAVDLELEYFVPGARWYPSYELDLERSLERGALRMRASVAQRTGEDWDGVRLRLSTADLARRAVVPELKALRIGRTQPPVPSHGWRPPPPGLDELFADHDAAVRLQEEKRTAAARAAPAAERPIGFRKGGPVQATEGRAVAASAAHRPLAPEAPPPTSDVETLRVVPRADTRRAGPPAGALASMAPAAPPMRAQAPLKRRAREEVEPEPEMMAEEAPAAGDELEDIEDLDLAGGGGTLPGVAMPGEAASAAVEPAESLLDYDGLVMAGASGRGRLQVEDEVRRDLAVIGLVATRVDVQVDVQVQVITAMLQRHRRESEGAGGGQVWPSTAVPPRASAGSYDYRYDAESAVDVPSDGRWHSVPVAAADVALSPRYVAVPAVEPKVFRTMTIANRSPHALLAGPADVSVGGELAMTVQLPTVPPRGEDRAGLGVEESIQVARNTRFRETTGGLLGGASVLQHEVEIDVRNNLARPVPVEIRERVPVPTHEQIKVEEGPVEPPWKPTSELSPARPGDAVAGARAWRVTVAPGEKTRLSAQYSIRIPGDQLLVGGNRRV